MEESDYSFSDKLLHHLVLGIPLVGKASFELDGILHHERKDQVGQKHVFISGLARAGTTVLMGAFYATGKFRSLTYRDMPFVLMPNVWKKLSTSFRVQEQAIERAHGDGIHIGYDSPEAFEEVFWRTFAGKEYVLDDGLQPHDASDELICQFRLYIQRIVDSSNDRNQQRYLSKNNNNILRLPAIRKAFPNALIVVPFREPLQHAISLLNQHHKFCARHSSDKFSYDYMRWLGHHEFGMTHKPFLFEKETQHFLSGYQVSSSLSGFPH